MNPTRTVLLVTLLCTVLACGNWPSGPAVTHDMTGDMTSTPTPTPMRNTDCLTQAEVQSYCATRSACVAHFTSGLHLCPQGGISWVVGDNMMCSGGMNSMVTVPEQLRVFFNSAGTVVGATQPRCSMSFGNLGTSCSDGKSGDTFYCF